MFVVFTLTMGLGRVPYDQEIIFAGSMTIVTVLMSKLIQGLSPAARRTLVGTAIVIFVYRALPGPGPGYMWWEIDVLGFDQQFIAKLSLIGSRPGPVRHAGLFAASWWKKSIAYVVGFPDHRRDTPDASERRHVVTGCTPWTAAPQAIGHRRRRPRFIAVIDLALEAPFGQVAMIPMLAWIANSAPSHLKATFFAVLASFTNLALSLRDLGTKYANQIFTITREVRDPASDAIITTGPITVNLASCSSASRSSTSCCPSLASSSSENSRVRNR